MWRPPMSERVHWHVIVLLCCTTVVACCFFFSRCTVDRYPHYIELEKARYTVLQACIDRTGWPLRCRAAFNDEMFSNHSILVATERDDVDRRK